MNQKTNTDTGYILWLLLSWNFKFQKEKEQNKVAGDSIFFLVFSISMVYYFTVYTLDILGTFDYPYESIFHDFYV